MANYSVSNQNAPLSDLDIHEAVYNTIYDLQIVRESGAVIHVNVLNGIVTLSGVALSRIMRRAILTTAASVPGVQRVIDNIATDSDIEIAIGQALAADPLLNGRDSTISVMSYRGEATLAGQAPSAEAVQKAGEIAAKVPGVINVVSRLAVPATGPTSG